MDNFGHKQPKKTWHYKIFIGGIPIGTSEKQLYDLFTPYGQILDLVIIKDKQSGRPRGFGFVTFKDEASFERTLENEHSVSGKKLDLKKALPRDDRAPNDNNISPSSRSKQSRKGKSGNNYRKVFIGGIPKQLPRNELTAYFRKYGEIDDIAIICDKKTKESRGFGFVTYINASSVTAVMDDYLNHYFYDKWVECKVAFPKDDDSSYHKRNFRNGREDEQESMDSREEGSEFNEQHGYNQRRIPEKEPLQAWPTDDTSYHSGHVHDPNSGGSGSYGSQSPRSNPQNYYYPRDQNEQIKMSHFGRPR